MSEAPWGIAADENSNVYVADQHHIHKFDGNGTPVTHWASSGSGVAVDLSGNVYAPDPVNSRIQKFDENGTLITQWGTFGSGNGQFNSPRDVAVDRDGNVYVADSGNSRIQKFAPRGRPGH